MKATLFFLAFLAKVLIVVCFKDLDYRRHSTRRLYSRAATSSLSGDESARSKNKIRTGIRNTRESLVKARTEGEDKVKRLFFEGLLNAKTSFLRAVEASVVFFIAVRRWLLSKVGQLQGQGSKLLAKGPAALPPAKVTPRLTTTLLPIEEAKLLVKKKLEESMPTRADSYATALPTQEGLRLAESPPTAEPPLTAPPSPSVVRPDPAEYLTPTVTKTIASAPPSIVSASSTSAAVSISTTSNEEATEIVVPSESQAGNSTMTKIKSLGTSGIFAYVISEVGFWLLSIPAALVAFHNEEGAWLQLSVEEDRAKILALVATVVTGARLLVPLRISIAVALTPLVERMRKGAMMGEEQSDNGESAASNT